MLANPRLTYNLEKIKYNAGKINELCVAKHLKPCFATKGFCAAYEIIEAVMEAGIDNFGDSRLINIIKVKKDHPEIKMTLLRPPVPQ